MRLITLNFDSFKERDNNLYYESLDYIRKEFNKYNICGYYRDKSLGFSSYFKDLVLLYDGNNNYNCIHYERDLSEFHWRLSGLDNSSDWEPVYTKIDKGEYGNCQITIFSNPWYPEEGFYIEHRYQVKGALVTDIYQGSDRLENSIIKRLRGIK